MKRYNIRDLYTKSLKCIKVTKDKRLFTYLVRHEYSKPSLSFRECLLLKYVNEGLRAYEIAETYGLRANDIRRWFIEEGVSRSGKSFRQH